MFFRSTLTILSISDAFKCRITVSPTVNLQYPLFPERGAHLDNPPGRLRPLPRGTLLHRARYLPDEAARYR